MTNATNSKATEAQHGEALARKLIASPDPKLEAAIRNSAGLTQRSRANRVNRFAVLFLDGARKREWHGLT